VSTVRTGERIAGQIDTQPNSILMFKSVGDRNGSAGSFPAPIEPTKFAEAVLLFQKTLLGNAGFHPADIERTTGAESGYAIQLKRSAQRRYALSFEPNFREGDLELIRKMCLVFNAHSTEPDLPTEGFAITYRPIEITPDELASDLEYNTKLVDAGMMDKIAWYQRINPGVSEEEATVALLRIAAINKAIESGGMVVSPDTADRIVNAVAAWERAHQRASLPMMRPC
jgi:hypothetical protein